MPPRLEATGVINHVCKLKKFIYGLKQSPRAWYVKLSSKLIEEGFTRCTVDHSLFISTNHEDSIMIAVYVDDIIIAGSSKTRINKANNIMKKYFDKKELGELRYFLGLEIIQSSEGIL